jgi:hypothetical protein
MAFDGREGGEITLNAGAALTEEHRSTYPNARKGQFFGKDILNEILNQTGCMGIRIYYGVDENGKRELVLVGADADENDMTNLVADMGEPCPTRCGTRNDLNS